MLGITEYHAFRRGWIIASALPMGIYKNLINNQK